MTRRWMLAPPIEADPALLALVDGQPIAAAALIRRGYADAENARGFLDPDFYTPTPANQLPDLDRAVELLREVIAAKRSILIWGDFDVDGLTATALLVEALRPLTDVHIHIPARLNDGHGVQLDRLKALLAVAKPDVLLTCDTGVTAHEAIAYARSRGVKTIVTDHHDLPPELPAADALVNPQRLAANHPLRALPGVGVAYKLIERLAELGVVAEAAPLLDLVALGIIADVAELVADTRYLAQRGLSRLQLAERPGLRALFDAARIDPRDASADQIGFQLGPRLNAAGRLGDPMQAIELLITRDPLRAAILAQELEGLNRQRRLLQRSIEDMAVQMVAADPNLLEANVLVLYRADWHAGVLGPVAGRLAERFERPVILLSALDPDGKFARGSGRSAPGKDLNAALSIAAPLVSSFGGHPGAAGVTLPVGSIPALRRAVSEALAQESARSANTNAEADDSQTPPLIIDAVLSPSDLTVSLAQALSRLAPFGAGNPPVTLLVEGAQVISAAFLDRLHAHRRASLEGPDGGSFTVYWWDSGDQAVPSEPIDLVYTLGSAPDGDVRLEWFAYRPHASAESLPAHARQTIDLRAETLSPREVSAALDRLRAETPGLQVWAEGYAQRHSPGLARFELAAGQPLAIFTAPPTPAILTETIVRLDPPIVYVFGFDPPPPLDSAAPAEFMRELDGIARFILNRNEGRVSLETLCSRLAQSPATIRHALRGLPGIAFESEGPDIVLHIVERARPNGDWYARLAAMLDETRAYRTYFRRAPLDSLRALLEQPSVIPTAKQ